jgi:8-oxo-dGTP pyrophosphatase MutT (NUDIX family)
MACTDARPVTEPMNEAIDVQQAAVIPYRPAGAAFEFCLITTMSSGRWSLPKGFIDPGESAIESAYKEALEEAGLHGVIDAETVGRYRYSKWGETFTVAVYLMEVTVTDDDWLECEVRQRRWATADEVLELIGDHPARGIFESAVSRLGLVSGPPPGAG